MEGLKILITGGTGFIGSNLVHFFNKKGHNVATTMRAQSNPWRISNLLTDIDIFKLDITDKERVNEVFAFFKPDIVINTIAYGGYHFETDSARILAINFNGTANLVESYVNSNAELLINTGSSSEYGFKDHPISEQDILEPMGPYAVSKAAATLYSRSRSIESNRKIVTLRLFSAYGEFEEAHRLIPYLIYSSIMAKAARLNDQNNVRDFIYVRDICDAYGSLIERMEKASFGEILNLGSGKEYKVGEVVSLIEKISGQKLNVEWQHSEERVGDKAIRWLAETSKMNDILNWRPKYSFEKGLSTTYSWFRENLEKYEVTENSKLKKLSE
ncbi:MAG: NAD-dependent epimerase/dehydratase family protein [Thermoplasmataceae archaeon]